MDLHVVLEPGSARTDQLCHRIREEILSGRLRVGDVLPPSRELARDLGIARSTVVAAYERLAGEGFLAARVGAGTYVAETLQIPGGPQASREPTALRARAIWGQVRVPGREEAQPFDFRPGLPDDRLFPYETWRRLLSQELRASRELGDGYGDPAGHEGLREAVARHLGRSRGLRSSADDVIITNGTQQAADLVGRVLLEPGDRVAVEDPGYPPPIRALECLGARVQPVPVDAEGLVVDALHPETRLVYVSPSHQFPLGTTMSLGRRLALLAWAERHGAAIVEDDYDSEFRFGASPVDPLRTLDRHGRVLYVGTFSKTVLPSFRLGFVMVPESLRAAVRAAKYVSDWHTSLPLQSALARFLEEGSFSRHLRRTGRVYAERRAAIVEGIPRRLGARLDLQPSTVGLHLAATSALSPGVIDDAVRRARSRGVAVSPLSAYARRSPAPSGVVLGFGRVDADRVDDGLGRLRKALDDAVGA